MKKYFTLLLFITLIFQPLFAQETIEPDSINELQEIVVSYQAAKLSPISFQNLSSKDLKAKSTGQEPSFLLAETPSITNYSDAGNSQGYSYFRLRGIDQTRINMTLDGVPLNEPEDQGAYFSNYPDILNSVRKIQIQRGVGTSKNGVADYGGSIQLYSPNLNDSTSTTIGLGYGSYNSFRAFGEYNSGIKNKKAIYVRASQIYSDGYKFNSSNNSQSLFLSSGLYLDNSSWKLNVIAGQQRNDMAWLGVSDSLITSDRRFNANSSQEKDKFFQCLAQLQNNWQINRSSFLQSSVYYTYLDGNYDFDFNNFLGFPSTEELYNYAFQSNLLGFFTNYNFSKNQFNWTTGIHGNIYDRSHIGSEKTLGQLYENSGYKNEFSVFTKADYTFKQISFYADIQSRFVNFDYKGTVDFDKISWQFINPKAGVSLALNSNSRIYYSIGNTGREPTRNDMFGGNDDLLSDTLGNALLFNTEAEYVLNQELGYRLQQKRLNFNVNLFYMDFRNEIVLEGKFGPNGLALTNNVEQSFRTGIELNFAYKVNKHFSLINNSSFSYNRIIEQTEKFSPILTPPIIVNQEALFTRNNFKIALSARYQSESFVDFANSSTLKSYVLINSRAHLDVNQFQFSIFANNLLNSKYFNNGYVDFDGSLKYFVQAPINFYASIQYNF